MSLFAELPNQPNEMKRRAEKRANAVSFHCVLILSLRFVIAFVNDFTYDAVFITQYLVPDGLRCVPFCARTHISTVDE